MKHLFKVLKDCFITPLSEDPNIARKEFILNILLVGSIVLSALGFIIDSIHYITDPLHNNSRVHPLIVFICVVVFCSLLLISRLKKPIIASLLFILIFLIGGFYTLFRWGADAGEALMIFVFVIVISGILINSPFAFFLTLLESIAIIGVTYLEEKGLYATDISWKFQSIKVTGVIFYALTFGLIYIVSWLFNRELENALQRAYRSEAELRKERDLLEIKVVERTKELQKVESEKMAQVYHFAEIGRLTSGLFHDLITPLNLVSLNLERIQKQSKNVKEKRIADMQVSIKRAIDGTNHLEEFINSVRGQIKHREIHRKFFPAKEIKMILESQQTKLEKKQIKVYVKYLHELYTFGNPIRFNQLISNLIGNAIEAFEGEKEKNKNIKIAMNQANNLIRIIIEDNGIGIEEENIAKIFEPFFSTKNIHTNSGIGLSVAKEIVENEFNGVLEVRSIKGNTRFTVEFPKRNE